MNWCSTYKNGHFKITVSTPSKIARWIQERIKSNSNILDIGCGQGRNSIFFAKNGASVDAVDLVDLKFLENLPREVLAKIHFTNSDILQIKLPKSNYDAVILARVIQYLPSDRLEQLIPQVAKSLKKEGFVGIGYNAASNDRYLKGSGNSIEMFAHPVARVKSLLQANGLKVILQDKGPNVTTNTPYRLPAKCYDILAQKI